MNENYEKWLKEHFAAAQAKYEEICRLDDEEFQKNGESTYYEQAHQMFGYLAALEKCLEQLEPAKAPKAKKPSRTKKTAKK